MRTLRSTTTLVAVLALGLSGVALSVTAASAAYEEERPGAESPSMVGNSSWKLGPPATLHAQRFTQPEDGRLSIARIEAYASNHQISSVALHSFTAGVGPSAEPIEGGSNVEITYESSPNTPQGFPAMWVVVDFVDRPTLEAGETYALVIDPAHPETGETASFVTRLVHSSDYAPWVFHDPAQGGTGWSAYATAHMIFSTRLVTIFGEPEAPTLETAPQCGVEPTIIIPDTEGVVYEHDRSDDTATITAIAADGYELPDDAVTEWVFDVSAEACPDLDEGDTDTDTGTGGDDSETDSGDSESDDGTDTGTGSGDESATSDGNGDLADTGAGIAAHTGVSLALLVAGLLLFLVCHRSKEDIEA